MEKHTQRERFFNRYFTAQDNSNIYAAHHNTEKIARSEHTKLSDIYNFQESYYIVCALANRLHELLLNSRALVWATS